MQLPKSRLKTPVIINKNTRKLHPAGTIVIPMNCGEKLPDGDELWICRRMDNDARLTTLKSNLEEI